MMRYSDYHRDLIRWFWTCQHRHKINDKRVAKDLAKSLGLRIPREPILNLKKTDRGFVLKPRRGCGSRDITLAEGGGRNWIVEELLYDEQGYTPPRTFDWYVFRGVPRFVQVHRGRVDGGFPSGYYTWPDWQPIRDIDTKSPWIDSSRPTCAEEMAAAAVLLDRQFPPDVHVRCDFYATDKGMRFGEMCVTPGLIGIKNRISDKWDRIIGEWISGHADE